MQPRISILTGLGLGAVAMYFLDPQTGKRRRAVTRDRAVHLARTTQQSAGKARRDVRNRLRGLRHSTSRLLCRAEVTDDILVDRVRAKLGRWVSHPSSIEVRCHQGVVTMAGPVLAAEKRRVLRRVGLVAGVRDIRDELQARQEAGEEPDLHGENIRPGARPALLQESWSPAIRWAMGAAGGALCAWALARRRPVCMLAGAMGTGILARSIGNQPLARLLGRRGELEAVSIQKTINVEATLEEVREVLSHPERFPSFMSHLNEVESLGDGQYCFTARGPAGTAISWNAELVEGEDGDISWRTLGGSAVGSRGRFHLQPEPDGRTRVEVQMSYNPPGGVVGHAIAKLFGTDAKTALDDDFVRLKSFLEEGRTRAGGSTVRRGEILH